MASPGERGTFEGATGRSAIHAVKRSDTGGEFTGAAATPTWILAGQPKTPAGAGSSRCSPGKQNANFEFATSVRSKLMMPFVAAA